MVGPENKALAEEYCWGREFIDLVTDFPGVVKEPQELFHVLQRLTPRHVFDCVEPEDASGRCADDGAGDAV